MASSWPGSQSRMIWCWGMSAFGELELDAPVAAVGDLVVAGVDRAVLAKSRGRKMFRRDALRGQELDHGDRPRRRQLPVGAERWRRGSAAGRCGRRPAGSSRRRAGSAPPPPAACRRQLAQLRLALPGPGWPSPRRTAARTGTRTGRRRRAGRAGRPGPASAGRRTRSGIARAPRPCVASACVQLLVEPGDRVLLRVDLGLGGGEQLVEVDRSRAAVAPSLPPLRLHQRLLRPPPRSARWRPAPTPLPAHAADPLRPPAGQLRPLRLPAARQRSLRLRLRSAPSPATCACSAFLPATDCGELRAGCRQLLFDQRARRCWAWSELAGERRDLRSPAPPARPRARQPRRSAGRGRG